MELFMTNSKKYSDFGSLKIEEYGIGGFGILLFPKREDSTFVSEKEGYVYDFAVSNMGINDLSFEKITITEQELKRFLSKAINEYDRDILKEFGNIGFEGQTKVIKHSAENIMSGSKNDYDMFRKLSQLTSNSYVNEYLNNAGYVRFHGDLKIDGKITESFLYLNPNDLILIDREAIQPEQFSLEEKRKKMAKTIKKAKELQEIFPKMVSIEENSTNTIDSSTFTSIVVNDNNLIVTDMLSIKYYDEESISVKYQHNEKNDNKNVEILSGKIPLEMIDMETLDHVFSMIDKIDKNVEFDKAKEFEAISKDITFQYDKYLKELVLSNKLVQNLDFDKEIEITEKTVFHSENSNKDIGSERKEIPKATKNVYIKSMKMLKNDTALANIQYGEVSLKGITLVKKDSMIYMNFPKNLGKDKEYYKTYTIKEKTYDYERIKSALTEGFYELKYTDVERIINRDIFDKNKNSFDLKGFYKFSPKTLDKPIDIGSIKYGNLQIESNILGIGKNGTPYITPPSKKMENGYYKYVDFGKDFAERSMNLIFSNKNNNKNVKKEPSLSRSVISVDKNIKR